MAHEASLPYAYDRRFRTLTLVASIFTLLLVVIGGIVRVTGSGLGCPDWPLCYGQVLPPPQVESIIEYSHRFTAGTVALMLVAIAVSAWRSYRDDRSVFVPAMAGVATIVVQSLIGAIVVALELPPTIVAIHLGTALIMFACVLVATTNAWYTRGSAARVAAPVQSRITSIAVATAIAVYVSILLGATVVGAGASLACRDWPLCQGQIVPALTDSMVTIHVTHRFAALASGILVALLAAEAWRARAHSPRIWKLAATAFGLFVAQVVVGGINVLATMPIVLRALHLALAASVWAAMVVILVVLWRDKAVQSEVGIRVAGGDSNRRPQPEASGFRATLGKYLRLSKPWIVVLLLITTLMSMLIAGKGSASLPLIVFTLLGGALASSGANAINSYLDRDIDVVMNRTRIRPIPRDQIEPRRALIFGLGASLASFAILALFVNLLAAVLAVFGIIYYVFIYTRWLKRTTPHNIVIGGIAGAMPPLVGWAAVTGRIDLLALYLFLIVFYWTPPHTWAMAILFHGDYERAGVPMLPVVRGEDETRRQIVLYSLQLIAVTLLVFAFRMLGWVYLVLALALNGLFLWLALRLMRDMDKPAAKRLYKFSQVYLALLFAAMVIDASVLKG